MGEPMIRIVAAAIGTLCLSACTRPQTAYEPPPKPISEMTFAERCAKLLELSGNYYLSSGQQAAAFERARNDGCMGQPQPQTIIVR
jgi:hypothetical protein